MNNYICNDCGSEFNEPDTHRVYMGEFWGMPAYEELLCCPVCKSDEFEEVYDNDM